MGSKKYKSKKASLNAYNQRNPFSLMWLAPILFIIGVLPLIVFARILEIGGLEEEYWRGGTTHVDFFSYYKSIYFIIASYIGFVIVIVLKWLNKLDYIDDKLVYTPIGIYILFTILSSFGAADSTVALRGFMELFQGVFVLVGYGLIIVTVYNLVRYDKHIKAIVFTFVALGSVITVLGISQYFGFDFFKTDFGKQLILPANLSHIAENLQFTFGANTIYATMYNTNFVGSFAALMVPLSLVLFFYAKTPRDIVLSSIFVGAMVFVAFGSNSRAGILGLSGGMILFIIFFRNVLIENYKKIIIPIGVVLLVGFTLAQVSPRLMGTITNLNLFNEFNRVETDRVYFEDVVIDGHTIEIITDDLDLYGAFNMEEGNIRFYQGKDGEVLTPTIEDDVVTFNQEGYDQFTVTLHRNESNIVSRFTIRMYRQSIEVLMSSEQFYVRGFRGEVLESIDPNPRIHLFDGYERMFSGRVFIWTYSIPLLVDNFVLGAGPDHYVIEFPQNEYVGRMNGIQNAIVDKPHNMYLQIGINTGTISLLALLSLFGIYFVDSARLFYNKNYKTFNDYIALGVFISVMSYLGAGMFNDQIISVAPLFYLMLGLGLALNRRLRYEDSIKAQIQADPKK